MEGRRASIGNFYTNKDAKNVSKPIKVYTK